MKSSRLTYKTYANKLEIMNDYQIIAALPYLLNTEYTVELFLDSPTVTSMFRGFSDFIDKESRHYIAEKTLVHALLFDNWGDKKSVLIPHQLEIKNKLTGEPDYSTRVDEYIETFIDSELKGLSNLPITGKQLRLRDLAFHFSNLEFLTREKGEIKNRIATLNKFLHLDKDKLSETFYKLIGSSLYRKILEGFSKLRGLDIDNRMNILDTLALVSLHQKLHFAKESKVIPIFFDDTEKQVFIKVIKNCRLEKEFTFYPATDEEEKTGFLVVQARDFVKSYLALREINKEKTFQHSSKQQRIYEVSLSSKIKKLIEYRDTNKEDIIPASKIGEIELHVKNFESNLDSYLRSILLDRFLLNNEEKSVTVLKDYLYASIYEKNEAIKEQVEKELEQKSEEFRNRLESNINGIAVYTQQLFALEYAKKKLLKEGLVKTQGIAERLYNNTISVEALYSLTKFDISTENMHIINSLVKDIILNSDSGKYENQKVSAISRAIQYINQGLYNQGNKEKREKMSVGLAVLWCFDLYDCIEKIMENVDYEKHNIEDATLRFFHAASIIMRVTAFPDAKNNWVQKIKKFIKCFAPFDIETKDTYLPNSYSVKLMIAYCYYHIWYNISSTSKSFFTTMDPTPPKLDEQDTLSIPLIKALDILKETKDWLEKKERLLNCNNLEVERYLHCFSRKNFYYNIINGLLFYTVMGGDNEALKEIDDYVGKLATIDSAGYGNKEKLWKHPYEDTLAIFNFRKGIILEYGGDYVKAKKFFENAKERNALAIASALGEERCYYFELRRKINQKLEEVEQKLKEVNNEYSRI